MPQLDRRIFISRSILGGIAWPHSLMARSHAGKLSASGIVQHADHTRIIRLANSYLPLTPRTVTSYPSPRSPGGPNDFYSEADYFWPDPKNQSGPYKEQDGRSNPENFQDHRKAMLSLSMAVPALAAAWLISQQKRYAERAAEQLRAWFVTPATRMNPNLEFSQAVRQGATGRSWGIIDTLHLAEVARAVDVLGRTKGLINRETREISSWFRAYLDWMQHSERGITERDSPNNHAVAWALQAAEFAHLTQDELTRESLRDRYHTLVQAQMGIDGSYPRELRRTKPYGYSIFNFDIMAALAWSLGREKEIRWTAVDGRGMCRAAEFIYPYLLSRKDWPYARDIQHFESWPVRSPGLLFCGLACDRSEYLELWKTLDPDPTDPEVNRNFPIRQPLLWV